MRMTLPYRLVENPEPWCPGVGPPGRSQAVSRATYSSYLLKTETGCSEWHNRRFLQLFYPDLVSAINQEEENAWYAYLLQS